MNAGRRSPPVYSYEVVDTWPHDRRLTRGPGLRRQLFESTGLRGQGGLRRVELKSGKVKKKIESRASSSPRG